MAGPAEEASKPEPSDPTVPGSGDKATKDLRPLAESGALPSGNAPTWPRPSVGEPLGPADRGTASGPPPDEGTTSLSPGVGRRPTGGGAEAERPPLAFGDYELIQLI